MPLSGILRQYVRGDAQLVVLVLILSAISCIVIYSASSPLAYTKALGNTEHYLLRHIGFTVLGFLAMVGMSRFNYKKFAQWSTALLGLSIILLVYTLFQGEEQAINQANRWISVMGYSFQTSDLAKISIIIHFSAFLTRWKDQLTDFNRIALHLFAPLLVVCALIAPANLSTALEVFAIGVLLMFIGLVPTRFLFRLVLGAAILGGIMMMFVSRAQTWKSRARDFAYRMIDPNYQPSFQTVQANIAIASGGLVGVGPGKSVQKNFLPHPYSDFVYAIILEEYGLVGGLVVLGLYVYFYIRCLQQAQIRKRFGFLLIAGLSTLITGQALVNMGVTVGLLPITGLTLPLISMGGTSIVFTFIAVGIILSVTHSQESLETHVG
jgi:cell division protein FtsW